MEGSYPDFSEFFEENIENLKIISSCPACSTKYNSAEIRLLEEKNDSHLVYIKCRKCATSVIALILANHLGVTSMGIVTDLNSEDVMKFRYKDPITTNDVIDLHNFLENRSLIEAEL